MIREAWKETGLVIEAEKIIGVYGGKEQRYTYGNGHQVEYLTIVFECRIKSGQLTTDNEEMKDLEFFPEHALPSIRYPDYILVPSKKNGRILNEAKMKVQNNKTGEISQVG